MERFIKINKGDVVVIPFPFSDSPSLKKRPSLVIADLRGDNAIFCLITSHLRPDPDIIELNKTDFQYGRLNRESFIMPSMIFTMKKSFINYRAGRIGEQKIKQVQEQLIRIFSR